MTDFSPHIALEVRNRQAAVSFYQEVLDMQLVDHEGQDTVLELDGMTFHLAETDEPTMYLEFAVDDLEETVARARAIGSQIKEVETPEGATSYLIVDPYGSNYHVFEAVAGE